MLLLHDMMEGRDNGQLKDLISETGLQVRMHVRNLQETAEDQRQRFLLQLKNKYIYLTDYEMTELILQLSTLWQLPRAVNGQFLVVQ